MRRVGSLIFAVIVLLALVIALDPHARAKAEAAVRDLQPILRKWEDVMKVPTVGQADRTPVPATRPVPTPSVQDGADKNSSGKPIIVINWDALGDALRRIWENLNSKINTIIKNNP